MKLLRSTRWLLLALLLSVIPACSYAGVFISVGFAPPVLPVYEQPPCPEPGLIWTPGYWAYGPEGYYWVPGAWVPAPYEGALWTPGYWGWDTGLYVWHPGYWGSHVGYYGGVNYGFGYFGIGFVGGMWRGHDFVYNTAVMHVDRRYVRNTYEDRAIVSRYTVANDRHVAYSGGPGGIRHMATAQERMAEHDRHVGATTFQVQHRDTAMHDRSAYFNSNRGRPSNMVTARPLAAEHMQAPNQQNRGGKPGIAVKTEGEGVKGPVQRGNAGHSQPQPTNRNNTHPAYQDHGMQGANPMYEGNRERMAQPQSRPQQQAHPQMQPRPQEQSRPQQQRPQQEYRPQQQRPQPQARPQQRPQQHEVRPEQHPAPHGDEHERR